VKCEFSLPIFHSSVNDDDQHQQTTTTMMMKKAAAHRMCVWDLNVGGVVWVLSGWKIFFSLLNLDKKHTEFRVEITLGKIFSAPIVKLFSSE
jgi:hypothetical protein